MTSSQQTPAKVLNTPNSHDEIVPPFNFKNRRKSSNIRSNDNPQFIDSLKARNKFFNHITIEPFAFLAILALYIEFPSIQDLIYTKICLQTITNYPDPSSISTSTTARPQQTPRVINDTHLPVLTSHINESSTLTTQSYSSLSLTNEAQVHFLCDRSNQSPIPSDIKQEITNVNSLFWLKYQIIICLLCVFSCPYWGGMSDKIGRLIPLNVPIVIAAVSNMISLIFGILISLNRHDLVRVEWLYLGATIIGLSGGQGVLMINSFGFISDNTTGENRSRRVVVLESVIHLAHTFGYLISKFIMSLGLASLDRPWLNRHIVAFTCCIILTFVCLLYSMCKLRHHNFHRFMNNFEREQYETFYGVPLPTGANSKFDSNTNITSEIGVASVDRPRELTTSTPDDLDGPIAKSDKRWTDWGTVLTLKYYKETYETATKSRETRATIQMLLFCGFISAMSMTAMLSLFYIYIRKDPFNWSTSHYSWWNAVTSITRGAALVGLTLSMKFIRRFNVHDSVLAIIGFMAKGIGLSMIALAQSTTVIDWSLAVFVLSEFSMPPIRSLLSKLVIQEEVGKVYSCLAAMQSICFLVGNIVFYLAFTSIGIQYFFKLSFLVVAGFQFLAVIIMLCVYTNLSNRGMVI